MKRDPQNDGKRGQFYTFSGRSDPLTALFSQQRKHSLFLSRVPVSKESKGDVFLPSEELNLLPPSRLSSAPSLLDLETNAYSVLEAHAQREAVKCVTCARMRRCSPPFFFRWRFQSEVPFRLQSPYFDHRQDEVRKNDSFLSYALI